MVNPNDELRIRTVADYFMLEPDDTNDNMAHKIMRLAQHYAEEKHGVSATRTGFVGLVTTPLITAAIRDAKRDHRHLNINANFTEKQMLEGLMQYAKAEYKHDWQKILKVLGKGIAGIEKLHFTSEY